MTPLKIFQRRYLGSKRQLLSFIHDTLSQHVGHYETFADLFAGTGVVAHSFNSEGRIVVVNELLYSNWCALDAFLGPDHLDRAAYGRLIADLRKFARGGRDEYLEESYGGRYVGKRDAGRIGAVRQAIHDAQLDGRLHSALVASLLYSFDKIAHTCGHYDSYRSGVPRDDVFHLHELDIPPPDFTKHNQIHRGDANDIASRIRADVVYLDPPYNSRQYGDAYHVLENVACWERPPLFGKARKLDRRGLKSSYNVKAAGDALADLVATLNCRHIVLSYGNMCGKGDPRSRNRIDDERIVDILASRGRVSVHSTAFRPFAAGRGTVRDHAERLFVCCVANDGV